MSEPIHVTKADYATCKVLAGPRGFYGKVFGRVIGARRDTIVEAWADVERAEPFMASPAGYAHAWRVMNVWPSPHSTRDNHR